MPLPIIAPLLLKFPLLGRLPWRFIGAVALVLLAWWQLAAWGGRREAEGVAKERARQDEAQRIATAEHDAKVTKLNKDHNDATKKLQGRVDELLALPATRTIRVPVHTVCTAQVPDDAGVPQPNPGAGFLEVDDPSSPGFRDWLIRVAGGPGSGG
jgi:cell division protein FtsB